MESLSPNRSRAHMESADFDGAGNISLRQVLADKRDRVNNSVMDIRSSVQDLSPSPPP